MKISTEYKKKIGIYCIHNICNNKKYIGSSKNIQNRLSKHRAMLRNNNHLNSYLQNAWNKYGEESFQCYIIELCDEDKLLELEQRHINKCGNYNLSKDAVRLTQTEEIKKKHSETKKKMFELGILESNSSVKICKYSFLGKCVKEYKTIRECCKDNNIATTTMYRHLKRDNTKYNKTLKGFIYKREFDSFNFKELILPTITDLEKNIMYVGDTYKDIMRFLNIKFQVSNYYYKPYKNRYKIALVKSCELLGRLEAGNQQPSLSCEAFEGSTTSDESQVDNNFTTSAGLRITKGNALVNYYKRR